MAAFNLTAELNLRGPSNLNQVVGNIRRQLSTLSLNLNINPNTSRGIQTVTANIRTLSTALRDAQSNAAALSTTLSNLATSINNAGNAANNAGNAINRLNNQTRGVQNAARDGATAMENFGGQAGLAIRRFAAFSVATGAVYAFTRALSSAYSEFVNFNKEFVRLQQVTNTTASGLSGLSQEITRLSTGLGVSSKELLTVSTTLAQAGLSATQTKTALEALAKSALAPSFDNLNDTVEGSIALMRQFGLSANDLESALGSINAVAAKFAVESSDIITAIQRTGGVFAAASKGVSQGKDALNEFIAVFTSVRATTRESAETIATGLRTIFTRIQRGNTIQALKEYGITLTDLEGKFVGPYEAVRRLSEGLRSLDPRDLRFSEIVEELGGFRQIGKVIPLIQQFATAQQALSVAQRGSGSLASDAAKAQEALAVRVTKVREEFIALIRDIGQTQSFQKFVDISLQLASALISVASAAKDVLPAITAIAAIRAVPAIAQFAGGFGRGLTRRNDGGPISRFATGGLVPGSGNGDTVPAMLTPGEFVIRKKAVEAIGVDKLSRMNSGGQVQKFAMGSRVRKGARSRFKELTEEELDKLSTSELIKYGKRLARDIFTTGGAGMVTRMDFVPVSKEKIIPELEPYLKTYLGQKGFWQEKVEPFGRVDATKVKKDKTKLSRSSALESQKARLADEVAARGQQWTSIRSGSAIDNYLLSALKEPILSDYKTSRSGGDLAKPFYKTRLRQNVNKLLDEYDDFDYSGKNLDKLISGIANKNFALGGPVKATGRELSNTYRSLRNVIDPDETYSANVRAVQVPSSLIIGDMIRRKQRNKSLPNWKNFEYAVGNKFGFSVAGGNKFLDFPSVPGEAKFLRPNEGYGRDLETGFIKGNNNETMLAKLVGSGLYSPNKSVSVYYPDNINAFRNIDSKTKKNARKKFAGGGAAEDTVPALLTPGEFVINKKAASRLGQAQLSRLNKADKLQGFNKGGPVGNIQNFAGGGLVQSFFIGGAVQAATQIVRQLPQLATAIAQAVRILPRNLPQGAGWLASNRGTRAMGLPQSRGGMARNALFDPMTLLFGAGIAGEGISSILGGQRGEAAGSGFTAGASVLGIAAQLGALSNPITALGAAALAGVSAISAYNKSIRESNIAENNKKIEASSEKLSKALENLSKSSTITGGTLDNLSNIIAEQTALGQSNRQLSIESAQPGFFANIGEQFYNAISQLLGGQQTTELGRINTSQLSDALYSASKTTAEDTTKIVSNLMQKGMTFGQSVENLQNRAASRFTDPKQQQAARDAVLRNIAVGRGGTEITQIEASLQQALEDQASNFDPSAFQPRINDLNKRLALAIDRQVKEFAKEETARNNLQKTTSVVISQLNLFAESIKNVEAAAGRASAEFQETQRQIDIGVGSRLGGPATISAPSRANENVLQNLRAYSAEEIRNTINQFGQNINLNPAFTQRSVGAARSQRVLETDLPRILSTISLQERNTEFGGPREEQITRQLKESLVAGGVDPAEAKDVVDDVLKNINKLTKGEVTIDDLLSSSEAFAKLYKTNGESIQSMINVMQSFNGTMEAVVTRVNEFASAIEQSINTQLQANQIRASGSLQLREALGENVPLRERNALFNNEILGMTATIGAGNRPIAGTGTTDPNEIARRLAAAEQRKRELEAQATQKGPTAFAAQLSRVTIQIRQYENALKKLASDTNRASNALNEISRLRQARQTRQESFLDFASNVNDQEYVMNLMRQAGAFGAVMSGQGNPQDLQAAIEGFRRRASGGFIPENQLDQERTQLTQQVIRVLERASGGRLPQQIKEQIASDFGTLGQEKDAITEFNNAVEAQARATEITGIRMREGANYLYDRVTKAADEWVLRTSRASAIPVAAPGAGNPVARANGGLIYANKGQLINFQPKGSDTVPAMLTPGEFVVNAKATKQNLGLLKQINNSGKAGGFSKGGIVYLADGGQVDPNENARRVLEQKINELQSLQNSTGEYIEISGTRQFVARAGFGSNNEAETRYQQYEQEISETKDMLNKLPTPPKPQQPQPAQQQQTETLNPRQKAQQEKERKQQAIKDEKERRKQEAMDRNPGYAARIRREEARKAKEATDANAFVKDKYGEAYEGNTQDNLKEYRQFKRERIAQRNASQARSDREISSKRQAEQQSVDTGDFEPQTIRLATGQVITTENPDAILARGSILSKAETEAIEKQTYKDLSGKGITKSEWEAIQKSEDQARASRIAKLEESIKENKLRQIELEASSRARANNEMNKYWHLQPMGQSEEESAEWEKAAREGKLGFLLLNKTVENNREEDNIARKEGYRDSADKYTKLWREDKNKADRFLKSRLDKSNKAKKQKELESIAAGQNAGVGKALRLQSLLDSDPAYQNQRKDYALIEFIKTRIQQYYGDDLKDSKDPARDRANLQRIVSSASAAYYDEQRRLKDQFNNNGGNFARQNLNTALQQFGQGINESPIFATPIALGKSGLGALEGVGGGLGYVAGKVIGGDLGEGLQESSGNVIERARARIEESGATLGVRLGLDSIAGGTYAEAATIAQKKIADSKQKQIEGSKGAYSTEAIKQNQIVNSFEQSTVGRALGLSPGSLGELLVPENVTEGAMNIAEVTGQAATDLAMGQTRLAKISEQAAGQVAQKTGRGISKGVDVLNRGIEGAGGKLVDIAEAGIESARTNAPLLPKLPLPKVGQRLTDALEARRVARETRRGQGALTREALAEAETGAKIAEANRGINVIPMEDIERDIAARVTRGYETNQRLGEMGIPPLDFSGQSLAQRARNAAENIAPENMPQTTSNFSRTTKSTDTASEAYEMSSREDFLRRQAERQAEIQTRKQAVQQSGKPSGSVSTPLDEPKPVVVQQPNPRPIVSKPIGIDPEILEDANRILLNEPHRFNEALTQAQRQKLALEIAQQRETAYQLKPTIANEKANADPILRNREAARAKAMGRSTIDQPQAVQQSGKPSGSVSTPLNQPKASGKVTSTLDFTERPMTLYAPGGRYKDLEDYWNIGGSAQSPGTPTGFKTRYAVKEGKMDELMYNILSDKDLAEQVRYMKQFKFDKGTIPSGADQRFLNFYSQKGDFESAVTMDKIISEKYKDLLVEGGGKAYGRSGEFDLPSGLGSTRYDPNIQQLASGQSSAKLRQSLVGKKVGGSIPFDIQQPIGDLTYTMGTGLKTSDLEEILLANPELFPNYLPANKRMSYYKAGGGLIYASKGTLIPYQPRGTDTVPAMLTPGEFVVNRQATQRNLPLLKAINNNSQYMSKGGKVRYFADGGEASGSMGAGGVSSFRLDSSEFTSSMSVFSQTVGELKSSLDSFGAGAGELARSATTLAGAFGGIGSSVGALSAAASILQGATEQLASPISRFTSAIESISSVLQTIPTDINLNIRGSIPPMNITVDINGGEGLREQLQPFANEIYTKIGEAISRATNGNLRIETETFS